MSRVMQIRVRIEAYYKKDLDRDFPRLARLARMVEPDLDPRATPLIDLAPLLVELSRRTELEPAVARAISAHGQKIIDAARAARDAIGSWELGKADKLLGDLEDDCAALEAELPAD